MDVYELPSPLTLLIVLSTLLAPVAAAQEPDAETGELADDAGHVYPIAYGFQAAGLATDPEPALDAIVAAGFNWQKQQIRWSELEPNGPGLVDWTGLDRLVEAANAHGVNLLFSVVTSPAWTRSDGQVQGPPDDYGELGRFLYDLASRYAGQVQAHEIWGEQNLEREWIGWPLSPGDDIDLLKVASPAIRDADPNAIVVSGGLTPTGVNDGVVGFDDVVYLDAMYAYEDGVLMELVDAIGAHASGYNNAPEDWLGIDTVGTPGHKDHPSFFLGRLDQLQDVKAWYGVEARPIWVTEYHWAAAEPPVPEGHDWTTHLTEEQVADFLVQGIQSFQTTRAYVGAVFVWNLNWRVFQNPHVSEQAIFGVLNEDYSPRPMYTALQQLVK